jgi:hypothetical protein
MSMGSAIALAAVVIAIGLFIAVVTWLARESARDRRSHNKSEQSRSTKSLELLNGEAASADHHSAPRIQVDLSPSMDQRAEHRHQRDRSAVEHERKRDRLGAAPSATQ